MEYSTVVPILKTNIKTKQNLWWFPSFFSAPLSSKTLLKKCLHLLFLRGVLPLSFVLTPMRLLLPLFCQRLLVTSSFLHPMNFPESDHDLLFEALSPLNFQGHQRCSLGFFPYSLPPALHIIPCECWGCPYWSWRGPEGVPRTSSLVYLYLSLGDFI